MDAFSRTMVMFQDRICVKSFIRYCHDNRLFRSTWSFCHIDIISWWPASRLGDDRKEKKWYLPETAVRNDYTDFST